MFFIELHSIIIINDSQTEFSIQYRYCKWYDSEKVEEGGEPRHLSCS